MLLKGRSLRSDCLRVNGVRRSGVAETLVSADEVEESPDPESADDEERSADDHDCSPQSAEHAILAICSRFTRVVESGPASESSGLVFIDHHGLLCCGYIINISVIGDSQERNLEKLGETHGNFS